MSSWPNRHILLRAGLIAAYGGILLITSVGAYTLRQWHDFAIPSKEAFMAKTSTGLTLTDRYGEVFFTFDVPGRKTIIPFGDMPPHTVQALIAAEDKTFYRHPGVSLLGIMRAAYLDYRTGSFRYGGSTITQQLTKMILLAPHKNFARKFREAALALKMERAFSKNDILEMYLNVAYFGTNAYGIEAAAQTYFRKPATALSPAESAYLIALLPAPTALSPFTGSGAQAKQRQQYVLRRMHEDGFLSAAAYEEVRRAPLALSDTPPPIYTTAPHFALWIRDQLRQHFTEEYIVDSGLVVTTSLDLARQRQMEVAVREHVQTIQQQGASNAAVVALQPGTGEILGMVGSTDWRAARFGKLNMAVSPRQTGSAFKPIVYAAGLQSQALTLATILNDTPQTYGDNYRPHNYNNQYRGRVSTRFALAHSLNIPAVDAITKISPRAVAALAQRMGISSLSTDAPHNLSLALGTEAISPLELTAAYGVLASGGQYRPPTGILAIHDKQGAVVRYPQAPAQRVMTEETAFLITSVLADNIGRRATFGRMLELPRPAAAKTGTTQDFRDAWTVGYTPEIAVGVWAGNNDNSPMYQLPGAQGAAPLWRRIMTDTLHGVPPSGFSPPVTVAVASICPRYGLLATSSANSIREYFIPGTQPQRRCPAPPPPPSEREEEPPDASAPKVVTGSVQTVPGL